MEAPEFVRVCLGHFREQGLPFMLAWSRTLHALPRGTNDNVAGQRAEWVEILKWSRPAWQASYEGCTIETVLAVDAPVLVLAVVATTLRPHRIERLPRPAVELAAA